MSSLFPYANIVAGMFILIVGSGFHWIGQSISLIDPDFATRHGLQEEGLLPEYKVYEDAIATADAAIGWIYGVAAVGLFLGADWGYKLAWIPGSILIYHAISAWAWEGNRRTAGQGLWSDSLRIGWCSANAITGLLALLVAWTGSAG